MHISRGTEQNIEAIARLLVHIWKSCYTDFLPASFLESMDVARQERRHRKYVEDGIPYFLAKDGEGNLVGFASYGPSRDPLMQADAELYTLYVDPSCQGQGLGGRLVETVIQEIGHQSQYLSVSAFSRNPYFSFYKKQGFVAIAEDSVDFGTFQEPCIILRKSIVSEANK